MQMQPLADAIRPQTLDEVAGQKHLLGPGAMLRRIIESGTATNLIFYGPSGTGKTTVAGIIAKQTNKTLYHLNATTASLQDVKNIMADVGTMVAPNGALLYLDEIQYFNKKQQQPVGVYGKRQDHTGGLHYGESVFLCVQRPALPEHGV